MKQYLRPSMSILSCESLSAKLQGSGAELICSGTECETTLGAECRTGNPYYININFFEFGMDCPVGGPPSCTVLALSIDGTPISNPGSVCHVADFSEDQCTEGCGVRIVCSTNAAPICSAENDSIEATVSCSGFDEPIACFNPA